MIFIGMRIRFNFFFILSWNISGAPNHRMFPNASEVSKMIFFLLQRPFWVIWSWSKNYLPVWMSQGPELWTTSVKFCTLIGPKLNFEDMEQLYFHQKHRKFWRTFCPYTEISRYIFINCYKVNNSVVICEKLNFQKSSVHKLGKKPENPIFGVLELNI